MGKKIIVVFCLISGLSFAQNESVIRAGLIKTTLTLSPSKSLSTSNKYFYLHGILEGYLTNSLSFSGEGYLYRGKISGGASDFYDNHALFFGFSKHFVKGNLDFHLGIQPGLSFTKVRPPYDNVWDNTKMTVNPLFSGLVGVNYFVGKYVHFFLQTRLVLGEHQSDYPINISDLRLSAGLGFNINSLK